jgi:hypothetical protein
MSELKVNKVTPRSGTTVTLGDSGDTITIPSGATLSNLGTATGFGEIISGTSVASTSGTSIDFTGLPSTVKRITVMFDGVSTSGSSRILLRIGAGSVDTSGYQATATLNGLDSTETSGYFACWRGDAGNVVNGAITLTYFGSNIWIQGGSTSANAGAATGAVYMGRKTLSGVLDRTRITTVNGTDTFDAGSINIMYE